MTFRALYRMENGARSTVPVIGVALDDWDDEALRKHAREAVEATVEEPDEEVARRDARPALLRPGRLRDAATFERVKKALGDAKQPVFYLEIPPSLFATVVKGLGKAGLIERRPRGDREALRPRPRIGPRAERRTPRGAGRRNRSYRIDHYLGKEPVLDITYLRFANSILEPVWNRELRLATCR